MRVSQKMLLEAVDNLLDRLVESGILREGDALRIDHNGSGWVLMVVHSGETGTRDPDFLYSSWLGGSTGDAFRLVQSVSAALYTATPKRRAERDERRDRLNS